MDSVTYCVSNIHNSGAAFSFIQLSWNGLFNVQKKYCAVLTGAARRVCYFSSLKYYQTQTGGNCESHIHAEKYSFCVLISVNVRQHCMHMYDVCLHKLFTSLQWLHCVAKGDCQWATGTELKRTLPKQMCTLEWIVLLFTLSHSRKINKDILLWD